MKPEKYEGKIMVGTIIEDSAYGFNVIDLFSCAEVKNEYAKGGSYARGGAYFVVQVRKHGEDTFTEVMVSSDEWKRYSTCMRYKITSEEYDTYHKIKQILET